MLCGRGDASQEAEHSSHTFQLSGCIKLDFSNKVILTSDTMNYENVMNCPNELIKEFSKCDVVGEVVGSKFLSGLKFDYEGSLKSSVSIWDISQYAEIKRDEVEFENILIKCPLVDIKSRLLKLFTTCFINDDGIINIAYKHGPIVSIKKTSRTHLILMTEEEGIEFSNMGNLHGELMIVGTGEITVHNYQYFLK